MIALGPWSMSVRGTFETSRDVRSSAPDVARTSREGILRQAVPWLYSDSASAHGTAEGAVGQHGRCERYVRARCFGDPPGRSMGRVHHVNLAGLFRVSPIVCLKNCYTRLQEGKVIAMGN